MFQVKIIADSVSPNGDRITTLQLTYPRFIHAEFMTHREFSRNASSSRAVPVARMLKQVTESPAHPIHWGKNQPGMQANEELTGVALANVVSLWGMAARNAAKIAAAMAEAGAHKQVVNRILEPFQLIHVLVTSTSFSNFFGLRDHPDAQPEIRKLAEMMKQTIELSKPVKLQPDQWHLPYIREGDRMEAFYELQKGREEPTHPSDEEILEHLIKISTARCARVSYMNHDGEPTTHAEDLKLFERLVRSEIIHASPAEHQATPDTRVWSSKLNAEVWEQPEHHGNFTGWIQHRKLLPNEYIK